MADDELAAALAEIRERHQRVHHGRGTVGSLLAVTEARNDTPRLLAAVEAALSAADGWKRFAAEGDAQDECAGELRKAIAAALTGKGNDGG